MGLLLTLVDDAILSPPMQVLENGACPSLERLKLTGHPDIEQRARPFLDQAKASLLPANIQVIISSDVWPYYNGN